MRDAHSRVGRVDALAAGTARAERVDAQIFGIDLDVDLFGLRKYRDGHRRSMDAALRLGCRDALHAMDAALVLQLAVRAAALDGGDDFLDAADIAFARRHQLDSPALLFREFAVHAKELVREERGFFAAGTRADFEHDVFLVVRVLRYQQKLD